MSPAVAERPLLVGDSPEAIGSSDGGRLTLGRKLDSVWEGLRADGAADCPVCGDRMSAGGSRHAAQCGTCRSRLR
jgi:tRNA(Ile2) C34 agmatinyltransferase TiaS